MKRRARRNPHALDVAWTGKKANYVSPRGNYGQTGHSELAMHTGGAGKAVVRFALWKRPAKGYAGPADAVNWAQVEYPDGQILDGLPSEVLPGKVRDIIGYGSPRMPKRKQKLQLWVLSKGVAANKGRSRRNSEATVVGKDATGARHTLMSYSGKDAAYRARLQVKRIRERAARGGNFFTGWKAGHAMLKNRKARKNVPETHPIFKASHAVHKFMSYLDNAHLRIWRDVPLAAIYHGGSVAKRAYAASVATVQGRMRDLASRLLEIGYMRSYKPLMKTPLRAIAGAFGLMEELRSDF